MENIQFYFFIHQICEYAINCLFLSRNGFCYSTFVCPTELIAFDDQYESFKKLNAEVIGISIDSHFTHLGWMHTKRNVTNDPKVLALDLF